MLDQPLDQPKLNHPHSLAVPAYRATQCFYELLYQVNIDQIQYNGSKTLVVRLMNNRFTYLLTD